MKQFLMIIFFLTQVIISKEIYDSETDSDKIKKSIPVTAGGLLKLNTCGGDVDLKSWDKNEVLVEAEGIDSENLENFKIINNGNVVSVNYKTHWGWDGAKFTITIPKDFNVEIKTAGGDVNFQGRINGVVQTSTSGGNIKTNFVHGSVTMKTSGGDITCERISGDGIVSTSGGHIKFKSVGRKIQASTSGGDIEIGNVGGNAVVKTSGGDIEIGDVDGNAEASTSGGDIEIGNVSNNAILKTAGGDIILKSANGLVEAKTAGGNIILKQIIGRIEAKTAGGDISAELIPSGASSMKTSGGNILLFVSPKAKATVTVLIENDWRKQSQFDVTSEFKMDFYEIDKDNKDIRSKINLNGGGEIISLRTTNGNVFVKEFKSKE